MNKKAIYIFFSVVFGVYFLLNYYLFIRGWQSFSIANYSRIIYSIIFFVVVLSYPLSIFLERTSWVKTSEPLIWIGSLWLGAMMYFFLIIVIIDFIRLLDYFFSFLPAFIFADGAIIACISIAVVMLLMIVGFINARNPVVKQLQIHIPKKANNFKELNIVAVSDMHIGMLIKHHMVKRLVKMIKELNPQLVLFAGDTIDEVLDPVIKYNLGEPLKTINAPLGVFAITGNHEFIGGIKNSIAYLESLGITVLKDEVIKISDSFYLAGRLDHDILRFTNKKRLGLEELLKDVDASLPLILLDHQPFHLDESAKHNVDLQISGHTHHGQMWPLNYITQAIFELSRGYIKKGNSHFYISSGFGSWGPPVRIGNRPEIVNIKLSFI